MKKLLPLVILLSIGITQIYSQPCYQCDDNTKAFTIGTSTVAAGVNSFAGGNYSAVTNTGNNGFAFGDYSRVEGLNGIALGSNAKVFQENGIAIGNYIKSNELNSFVFGMGTSSSFPLINNKPNSLMFGVSEFPSLTIVKPVGGADRGYLGIGTAEPTEMAHVVGTLLIDRTEETASSLRFKHPDGFTPYSALYWDIYSDAVGLRFNTIESNGSNVRRIFISGGGSVGIGTNIAIPLARLHVDQNILAEGDITTFNKFVLAPDLNLNSNHWEISRTGNGLNYVYNENGRKRNFLFIGNDGNVGIGKTNPAAMLDVNGLFQASSTTITGALTANSATIINELTAGSATITNALTAGSANITGALTANSATINGNANITGTLTANSAIIGNLNNINATSATITGTLSANLLSAPNANINGKIKTKEIEVTLSGWSDFVFENNYNLRSLSELEQYIKQNNHLPNIPSAQEVEENGVNLGEMQSKLLQKIEEMTLYILQQDKKITDLQNQINEFKYNKP